MLNITKLFQRKDSHPLVIDIALLNIFGPEWFTWDGDSAIEALTRQLNSPPSRPTKQKILALGVVHTNNAYWEDWRATEAVSWALSGRHVDLVQMNPVAPVPLVYGYRTARWIDSSTELSEDVESYIIATFLKEQYSLLPVEFSFLQDKLLAKRPDLRDRSAMVKEFLIKGVKGASITDESVDPVGVEVTKHRSVATVINIIGSPSFVLFQAKHYGLERFVKGIIEGVKK